MPKFHRLLAAPRQPIRLGFAGQALATLGCHELDRDFGEQLLAGARRHRVSVGTPALHAQQVDQFVKAALDALEGGDHGI
jgi:hypothetical protein